MSTVIAFVAGMVATALWVGYTAGGNPSHEWTTSKSTAAAAVVLFWPIMILVTIFGALVIVGQQIGARRASRS